MPAFTDLAIRAFGWPFGKDFVTTLLYPSKPIFTFRYPLSFCIDAIPKLSARPSFCSWEMPRSISPFFTTRSSTGISMIADFMASAMTFAPSWIAFPANSSVFSSFDSISSYSSRPFHLSFAIRSPAMPTGNGSARSGLRNQPTGAPIPRPPK